MKTNVLFLLILFLLGLSGSAQTAPSAQERQLVDELNRSRSEAGLPPLKLDLMLVEAAREHSARMADQRKLTHVLPEESRVAQRIASTGLNFNRSGENVGYNTDFNGLHPAWMKSPGHRANILDPRYNSVGIGLMRGSDGTYWATQDFAYALPQRSADQAEDLAARRFAQLRKNTGAPALKRVNSSSLRDLACKMGDNGRLNPKEVLALPGVRYAITYSNSSPEDLPSSAQQMAADEPLKQYSVGACFVKEDNPGGMYYVVMAFY